MLYLILSMLIMLQFAVVTGMAGAEGRGRERGIMG